MEADGSAAQFEIVKLNEILTGLEMMTKQVTRERPIKFGIRRESTIETIESDGSKLQQILVQLLTNALKFTEKGKIELSIRSTTQANNSFIEIGVADTGIGIRSEDQALIFEDFRQLDGSSKRQYGGTGLGLGLCKKSSRPLWVEKFGSPAEWASAASSVCCCQLICRSLPRESTPARKRIRWFCECTA